MELILPDVPATPRNVPHDLLARLYREIGVSAVATELGLVEAAPAANPVVADESGTRQAA